MTNSFPTRSLQIMNLAAILDLKIFTNIINECLDYQYFIGYFQNAFVSTLSKIIWKINIFNVGHFGLRIAALMGKIQGGSWSIWNQRAKITLCANFYVLSLIWTIRPLNIWTTKESPLNVPGRLALYYHCNEWEKRNVTFNIAFKHRQDKEKVIYTHINI